MTQDSRGPLPTWETVSSLVSNYDVIDFCEVFWEPIWDTNFHYLHLLKNRLPLLQMNI